MQATIEFRAVAERADLRALILADLGPPGQGGRWLCPFHDDRHPDLSLDREGRRFRCWSCGAKGDAIDWVSKRAGISKLDAALRLDGGPGRPARPARPKTESPTGRPIESKVAAWKDPDWQAAVDRIVCRAEEDLWSPTGRPALDWLRGRGLSRLTIRSFRLGFNPSTVKTEPLTCLAVDDGSPRSISAARGITIPWGRPGSWYVVGDSDDGDPGPRWVGVNVRRLAEDLSDPTDGRGKYRALTGSTRGFPYPHADVTPGVPALIVEGEFDALIGWQELGWVINPMTFGGAGQVPRPESMATLAACPKWLLSLDHDAAGSAAFKDWWRRSPDKAIRVNLPSGKDLSAALASGLRPLDWLAGEFDRLGWRWPLRRV